MKISFYSNYLNHHQLPFCNEMVKMLGDKFTFVATEPIEEERIKLGYSDMNKQYPFVLRSYENNNQLIKARLLAEESDVLIIGSAPNEFLELRMKHNKLTFKYSERIFKKGTYRRFIPSTRKKIFNSYLKYLKSNYHILCASAYTAYDLSLLGFDNKMYKWGYFPEVKKYSHNQLIDNKNKDSKIQLLWVGRFLNWKHPDDVIKVAYMLKNEGYSFTLNIIGTGKMESQLRKLIRTYKLSEYVNVLGSMSPEEVRYYMEMANIYLFTSDFNEGWGAVLNESMNSGCAVVASHAIGSVPFLIKDKENGLIYRSGDIKHLYNSVKIFLDDHKLREKVGIQAYETLNNKWNAQEASKRFVNLAQSILMGSPIEFNEGPCSKAQVISNKWIGGCYE